MATFIPGSGAIALGYDIGGIAYDNGCFSDPRGSLVSMWDMWFINYYFYYDFAPPYNFGFFYGQGCPASLTIFANNYVDPYSEVPANWGIYYKPNGGNETFATGLNNVIDINPNCSKAGNVVINSKWVGQTTTTAVVGVRSSGKSPVSVEYDGQDGGVDCPNTNNGDYGGTADYPSSCAGQLTVTGIASTVEVTVAMTINVNKSGYYVTC